MSEPCKACAAEFIGNFCPNCGQKRIINRITFKESVVRFAEAFFNLEKGFLHNVRDLTIRPEKVLHNYLGGVTVSYFAPFRYLLVAVAVNVFLVLQFDAIETQQEAMGFTGQPVGEEALRAQQAVQEFFNKYLSLLVLITTPLSAWGYHVVFRKRGYYYGEQLVIYCFLGGHSTIIQSMLLMLTLIPVIPKEIYVYGVMIVPLIYFAWALKRFYKIGWIRAFFSNLLAYILTVFFALFVFMFGSVIYFLLFK